MSVRYFLLVALILFLGITNSALAGQTYINGFISQGYFDTSSNNFLINSEGGTFQFSEMGINFATSTSDKLRLALQLMSRTFGTEEKNSVEVDWAFGDYMINDNLGFRAGRIKTPFGLYNKYWDMDFLRTSILLPNGIYAEDLRNVLNAWDGFELYGTLFADTDTPLEYELIYGSTTIPDTLGILREYQSRLPGTSNYKGSNKYNWMATFTWQTGIDGLKVGYTGAKYDVDIDYNYSLPTGALAEGHFDFNGEANLGFLEFTNERLKLASEYMFTDWDLTSHTGVKSSIDWMSWYVMSEYAMNEKFNLGTYYSVYYPDKSDQNGTKLAALGQQDYRAWLKDTCLTLRYNINDSWNVKGEVHFMDGAAKLGPWLNTGGYEKDWTLYVLKTTYNF